MSTIIQRLEATTRWAERIQSELGHIKQTKERPVHFRPSSRGVAMVGLTPDRPQRGESGIEKLGDIAKEFESRFDEHCLGKKQGRPTPEKALQSFLIREALLNGRRMTTLEAAVEGGGGAGQLLFVTDELSLLDDGEKVVCDLLALHGESTPVVIELKSARQATQLAAQVTRYARLVDHHREQFSNLFTAILGRPIELTNAAEKCVVWPAPKGNGKRRHQELKGIQILEYRDAYSFQRVSQED